MSESENGTSPAADETPAEEVEVTRESDPGVGPSHYAGTTRGEDRGKGTESDESGREKTGEDEAGRPHGESSARDATTINPQEGDS